MRFDDPDFFVMFQLVVMVTDAPRLGAWPANGNFAWSYRGMGYGLVPCRPLGFPTDRDLGDFRNLVRGRWNWATLPINIVNEARE